MINGFVNKQKLKLNFPIIAEHTIEYLEGLFVFQGTDWDNTDKWVFFTQEGQTQRKIHLVENKITKEANLNLSAGNWEVSVMGNDLETGKTRITTIPAILTVKQTNIGACEPLEPMSLSTAEQISILASRAEQIANSVRDDADAGAFVPTINATAKSVSYNQPANVKKTGEGKDVSFEFSIPEGKSYEHSDEFTEIARKIHEDAQVAFDSANVSESSKIKAEQAEAQALMYAHNALMSEEQAKQHAEEAQQALNGVREKADLDYVDKNFYKKTETYSQAEIDKLFETGGGSVDLTDYAKKSYVDQNFYDKPTIDSEFKSLKSNINTQLDSKQPKGDYLQQTDLQSGINSALEQAKATGLFDGKNGLKLMSAKQGGLEKQPESNWDVIGRYGQTAQMKNISNATEFSIGDTVVIAGLTVDTNKRVSLFGRVTKVQAPNTVFYTTIGYVKDGANGANGKTPVKGTDYFTESDKTELVNDVLNALPQWNGGAF